MTIASQHFQSTHFPKNTNTQPLSFKDINDRVKEKDSMELFSEDLARSVLTFMGNEEEKDDFLIGESGVFNFLAQFQKQVIRDF